MKESAVKAGKADAEAWLYRKVLSWHSGGCRRQQKWWILAVPGPFLGLPRVEGNNESCFLGCLNSFKEGSHAVNRLIL